MMMHDSIWIESPEEETKDAMAITRELMTTIVDLDVPLEVKFE
jgi:DNA polymerase I-like protein with 3'-5' exonuclease and polymerase domains